MNDQLQAPQGVGLNMKDIYYVLFRRKRMIALFSVAGIFLAALVYIFHTPEYQSEAKVLVRYIVERKSVNPAEGDPQPTSAPDDREDILNSELEILSSFDLARKVAGIVGPERIIGHPVEEDPSIAAAVIISENLKLDIPNASKIIRITFKHRDAGVAREVLVHIIQEYTKKHLEIHRALGFFEDLATQKSDQLRLSLKQTEDQLRELKKNAGIISIEDSRKAYAAEMASIRQDMLMTKAELEQRRALLGGVTNSTQGNESPDTTDSSRPLLDEYLAQKALLEASEKRVGVLLLKFKDDNQELKSYKKHLSEQRERVRQLERTNPELVGYGVAVPGGTDPMASMAVQTSMLPALEAKVHFWSNELNHIQMEAAKLDEVGSKIMELERKRELDEGSYKFYNQSLEQARMDAAIGPGKVSNIPEVQAPSPPMRASSTLFKVVGTIVFGSVCLGVGLAFFIELFLNPTIKRPIELQDRVNLPLIITIPDLDAKAFSTKPGRNGGGSLAEASTSDTSTISYGEVSWKNGTGELAPWDPRHPLRTYFEALSNRLTADFEIKNLTHKPKLVALTSCNKGAGVSTLATGLAASLSEDGGGNVLLVDMNQNNGAAHPLYQGKPACGLPEVFEHDKRNIALVQDNFYMVSANHDDDNLPRILPKRFYRLMPKMKASDYDYIIFDMPPIDRTGVTARMAGFMDSVVLVIESEKTNLELVRHAKAMLDESKANTCSILNKYHKYVPEKLSPEG